MKKYVLLVMCCAGMVFATDYNPLTDWVDAPGTPDAWSYGARIETGWGTGEFGDFIPGVHSFTAPFTDQYLVVGTYNTCVVGKTDPWLGKPGPIMNAWVVHQATVRVTPEAGTYNIAVSFEGTGYINPPIMTANVYVVKNGNQILFHGQLTDYITAVGTTLTNIAFNAGDYLDFILANGSDAGEARAALTADLMVVPGPNPSECAVTLRADLNFDCVVDFADFVEFADQWLECTQTDNPNCQP